MFPNFSCSSHFSSILFTVGTINKTFLFLFDKSFIRASTKVDFPAPT